MFRFEKNEAAAHSFVVGHRDSFLCNLSRMRTHVAADAPRALAKPEARQRRAMPSWASFGKEVAVKSGTELALHGNVRGAYR
jgi:hypothetical protein